MIASLTARLYLRTAATHASAFSGVRPRALLVPWPAELPGLHVVAEHLRGLPGAFLGIQSAQCRNGK